MKNRITSFFPSLPLSSLFSRLPLSSPLLPFLTFLLIFCATQVATAQIPSTGLVGYWPFNGNANDESGNGNNGTVYGATLTTDRNGNANSAYSFNGGSNYIAVPYSSTIGVQQEVSISFWVYFNGGSCSPRIIQSSPWGQCGGYTIFSNSGSNVSRYFYTDFNNCVTGVNSPSSPSIGALAWHHVVFTASGLTGITNLYFDGTLAQSVSTNHFFNSVDYFNHPLTIGNVDPYSCDWFGGLLDEIGIYNRILNQSEVTALFTDQTSTVEVPCTPFLGEDQTVCAGTSVTLSASGSSLACPTLPSTLQNGLVGYWPFCGNANDASGNGNNGTVNGATLTTDRFGNANSAYGFDGLSGINCSMNAAPSGNQTRSLNLWIKTDDINQVNKMLAGYGNDSPLQMFSLIMYNINALGKVAFWARDNDTPFLNSVEINEWTMFSVTYDGSAIFLYENGVLILSNDYSFIPLLTPQSSMFHIGDFNNNVGGFNGKIDDVSLWNRNLTQQEIQQLYTLGQSTYFWSTGATTASISVTPTQTTTYTCTVTTNGVTCTDSVTVVVNNPTLDLGSDVTVCGTSTTLTAPSGYDTYVWSNGGTTNSTTVTANGTYSCSVTQGGCSVTDSIDVTLIDAVITASSTVICAGETVSLSVPQGESTSTACTVLPANLQNGLVGFWPFCGNANDASGNGNNGAVNGPMLANDRNGVQNASYHWDGTDDYIAINPLFNGQVVPNYSISVWFKPESSADMMVWGKSGYWKEVILYKNANNKIMFFYANPTNQYFGSPEYPQSVIVGEWNHVVVCQNNSQLSMYLNGQFLGTSAVNSTTDWSQDNGGCSTGQNFIGLGRYCQVYNYIPFLGNIDDLAFWNKALSQSEVEQLYSSNQTSYLWSNGATTPTINVSPTSTTTYTCTITVNGVSCTDSITVVVNNTALDLGGDVTLCGTSTTLTAPTGYDSYAWSNGATTNSTTVSANGTYTCTVTQGGCSVNDTLEVTLITIDAQVSSTSICAGAPVELTGSSNLSLNQNSNCIGNTGSPNPWPYPSAYNAGIIDLGHFGAQNVFSISAWLNVGATQNGISIFLDASHGGSANWVVQAFGNNTYTWGSLSFTLTPNVWQHVLLTYVNGSKKCYIDGQLVASVYNPISYSGSPELYLGNWPEGGRRFNGLVDELYITYSELESANFTPLQVVTSPSANSFGLWHFDEGSNSSTLNSSSGSTTQIGSWYWATRDVLSDAIISWNGVAGSAVQTVSPLATTTYISTVTMNSVTCSDSVTVVVNNPIINLGTDVTACGTSTTLTAPTGYDSYAWSNGGTTNTTTVTANGTYTCTVTQGGCSASDAVDVTLINPTITASDSTICAGQTITLSVPQGGSSNTACAALPAYLQTGLVGYWPFCGNANDASGNGNNGTVIGATLTTDRFGNGNSAYSFDGNDFVEVNSSILPLINNKTQLTFSYWFNASSTSQGAIWGHWSNNNGGVGVNCGSSSGYGGGSIGTGNYSGCCGYVSGQVTPYSTWHLATVVFDASQLNNSKFKIYIDGIYNTTAFGIANATTGNGTSLFFGRRNIDFNNFGDYFSGLIDDLAVWNHALSPSEIQQLYTLGQTTYLWSNGATTPTINVSPATTTTYTCTVTTNGVSCTNTITVVVGNPVASITPNGIVEICQGQSIALTANGGVSYLWNTGAPTQSITVNTEAVYSVTVTDANGCTDTESQLVKVNFLPNIGVNNASICAGQSATLTATGGLSYVWSPATGLSATTGSTVTASSSTSTVYTVTGIGANGCTNTATAAVTVNALPTATITPATATTFCQGGSVVLNANTGTGLSYQWKLNGTNITGATSSSYTANASGSYTVTVTNASTCSATSTATVVTVNALPTATITPATTTTFCQGGSVVLNANTGTGLTYQWFNNATAISGATNASYTANASGSYTVVVTNASTCSSTSTATVVTVNALPTATITAATATTFCQGGSVVLNANTGAGLTYQWRLNGNPISGATASSYTANASGSYTVVVTNTSACSATSTATVVTVNALPTSTITASSATTFCQGGSVVLTANTGTGLSYQWFNNAVAISGATSSSYTANASGSYTVVVTNASTCSSTSTATVVTVNALPTSTITASSATTFCQGGSVVLTANTGTGLTYQWKLNGTNITGATSSSYTANASGSYTVVVTNVSTCSATSTATVVTVNALPTATITPATTTTFCQGGSVVLNANTGTGLTYQWFNNASAINGATSASYTATTSGSYTVVVTNASSCSSTSTSTAVTVNALPTATITTASATTFCQGGSVALNANTGTGLSYQWKLNGTNITGATSSSYTANASGSYTVVVTNASTCSSTSTATVVTVNALPTATITPATATTFCQGGSVVLTANTGTGLSYQWKLNGTNITGATTSSYTANASGSYTVVVTNTSTCSATSTATVVTVNALPTATSTPATATTFCQGGSVVLNANTGTGLTYQWFNNASAINGATSASYTATTSGSYTVVVTNASSCSSTSTSTAVTVNALPTATITTASATTFCQGGSVVLNANTGTGLSYQWKLNGTNITGATSSSYTANASGSYTVVVTNASSCSATSTATVVTVNALPTATVTPATATTFCQGGSVVLNANTGTGLTYQWRLNGTNITGATSSSYTANASGSYTVVVTNASTCSSTSTATVVTVNALPTSTITPATAPTFCQGGSVVLNANTGTGLTYQWFNNATAISGATSASYTATTSGSYTVVVTNTSSCSSTSTATVVTVNALPTATITAATATTFCQGGSVVLNANTGTGLSYQWFNNATAISGATAVSYTATTSGSYTVVVTNASTCSSTSTATVVTVNALPTATITPATATTFCQGGSVVLNANTGTGLTYQWRLNGTNIIGATSSSYTANASGSYTVVVTNASTCSSTSTATVVTVNSLPTATITPATATTFCQGGSVVLNANTGTGLTYQWFSNASAIGGATSASYTATISGSYTVVVTNVSICSSTSAATVVTVNALPTATITPATATTFCQGGSVVLNANTGAGLSYQWRLNGNSISGATSASYTANASGSYTVVVTNASTCSATSTAIDVTAVPNVDYFADADGDGFGDVTTLISTCVQPQGYVTDNTDCKDNDAAIHPGAQEICNDIDDDCNDLIDDGLVFITYYADADGDSFGDVNNPLDACLLPDGYVTNNTDCNDNNANQNAASTEICNGEDDDCDGTIDNGLIFLDYYADLDSDGFGAGAATNSCVDLGAGYVTNNSDCNNANASINPNATEICNSIDDNCDGQIDEGITFTTYYHDFDNDGFGTGDAVTSCTNPGAGWVTNNTDCDDTNANTFPGTTEVCNTIDDNCDGQTDEGVQTVYFIDNDGDTFGNPSVSILACTQPIGYTPDDTDCNDIDASINPGAEDIAGNGIDENCDGQIDNSILELSATINLYPNPTRSELNIQVNSSIIGNDLYIFDAVGKLVHKQQLLSTQTILPVSNFADGNYVVRIGEVVKRFEVIK